MLVKIIRSELDKIYLFSKFLRESLHKGFPFHAVQPIAYVPFQEFYISKETSKSSFPFPKFLENIFWATPKQRKSYEVRAGGRMGMPEWYPHGSKLLRKKHDLVTCETCGNWYQRGCICLMCYRKVEEETRKIHDQMTAYFKTPKPIKDEMLVRYRNDPKTEVDDKILVEIDDERPEWFSKGLLAKAGQSIQEVNVTSKH